MSISFLLQYLLFMLNLTKNLSPIQFPEQFADYPLVQKAENQTAYEGIKYIVPVFFHFNAFMDLKLSYMIGVGIESNQVQNLVIDFLNLWIVGMYLFFYSNPILAKSMHKVFWLFPKPNDKPEKWDRLDREVKDQVIYLTRQVTELEHDCSELEQHQQRVIVKYQKQIEEDLNDRLVQYVDLKYYDIWSDEYCRKKKWELKEQNFYFRTVKQGSQMIYLSNHVAIILIVLYMAILRQSLLALGYVLILMPHIKNGADVFSQNKVQSDIMREKLKNDIKLLQEDIEKLQSNLNEKRAVELEEKQEILQKLLKKQSNDQKKQSMRSFSEKVQEKSQKVRGGWVFIIVIERYLMIYACLDFFVQILGQMPIVSLDSWLVYIGLRKVWLSPSQENFTYTAFLNDKNSDNEQNKATYSFMWESFWLQTLNIFMICALSFQTEIFYSNGYLKYISQQGGSMDHLMKIAPEKAKAIAYMFNNEKIIKIVSIQKKKETINATVERVKDKVKRWRQFTRTTLENRYDDEKTHHHTQQEEEECTSSDQDIDHESSPLKPELTESGTSQIKSQTGDDTVVPSQSEGEFESEVEKSPVPRKEKKSVGFHKEEMERVQVIERRRLRPEEAKKIQRQLATELIEQKKHKLNCISKIYLWLHENFVMKILFKNNSEELDKIVKEQAKGEIKVRNELENIMQEEAEEIIRNNLANTEGDRFMANLIARTSKSSKKQKNLLALTEIGKQIKLVNLQRTYKTTRCSSMCHRLTETMFYMLISNTQGFIYFFMILSMYVNAGITSLVYPFAVFGYALLEETRPRKAFWDWVRSYTVVILSIKFFMNLEFFDAVLSETWFIELTTMIKLGLYKYQTFWQIVGYMLPEVMIIAFIMLHEIHLRIIGLYYQTEEDVESIEDAIQRNIEQGDVELVAKKKLQKANMMLKKNFDPLQEQYRQIQNEIEEEEKLIEEEKKNDPDFEHKMQLLQDEEEEDDKPKNKKEYQERAIKEVSISVQKNSYEFEIDYHTNQNEDSRYFKKLIEEKAIVKTLESDQLIYIEGGATYHPLMITKEDVRSMEYDNLFETLSAGDNEALIEEKYKILDERNAGVKSGFFKNSAYFRRIFPQLKIQKPGYDLYASSTFLLGMLAIFVFLEYGKISVDQTYYLQTDRQNVSVFKGEMVLVLLFIIFVIIIERYTNRTDTKPVRKGQIENEGNSTFFKSDDIFKRSMTNRSMTVKIKTQKTADLQMQDDTVQNFLKSVYGNEADNQNSFETTMTKITRQQKCKYFVHIFLIIVVHIFVFWFVPLNGNLQLYGKAVCDQQQAVFYGCKNFHSNPALIIFYLICCLYLIISALQMRYGFPIHKKHSSVLQYEDNCYAQMGAQIYMNIPFLMEIRNLLDYTFSKTSMDVFQINQMFMYHYNLYNAKVSGRWYKTKRIGLEKDPCDWFLCGILFQGLLLLLIIGPLLFFSDAGGFVQPNPVLGGRITLDFVIQENITLQQVDYENQVAEGRNVTIVDTGNSSQNYLISERTYKIFDDKHPFLKQYSNTNFTSDKLEFLNWTETRFFTSEQTQDCVVSTYSNNIWEISNHDKKLLAQDIDRSLNKNKQSSTGNHSLKIKVSYQFNRELPEDGKTAKKQFYKELNLTNYFDCRTAQQLKKLPHVDLDCNDDTKNKTFEFILVNSYNKYLTLGRSTEIEFVEREGRPMQELMHDMKLVWSCQSKSSAGEWEMLGSDNNYLNKFNENDTDKDIFTHHLVNPDTCQVVAGGGNLTELEKKLEQIYDKKSENSNFWRLRLTLFSQLVSGSIFAAYSIIGFYTGVTIMLSSTVRVMFIGYTYMMWQYETIGPDVILRVIDSVVMRRHEEDLVGEEENYRLLVEIIRSPEMVKLLSSSSLRGTMDPIFDKMSPKERKKLEQIDQWERKGLDVGELKEKMIEDYKKKNNLDRDQ